MSGLGDLLLGIDLASRRVQILGSTPSPNDAFLRRMVRTVTEAEDGLLVQHRLLICDRDRKWSAPVRARLAGAGIRVVQTPLGCAAQLLRLCVTSGALSVQLTESDSHPHYSRSAQAIRPDRRLVLVSEECRAVHDTLPENHA